MSKLTGSKDLNPLLEKKIARKIFPDTDFNVGQDSCILERIRAEVFKAEIKMGR